MIGEHKKTWTFQAFTHKHTSTNIYTAELQLKECPPPKKKQFLFLYNYTSLNLNQSFSSFVCVFLPEFPFLFIYLKFPPCNKVLHSAQHFYCRSLCMWQPVDKNRRQIKARVKLKNGHFVVTNVFATGAASQAAKQRQKWHCKIRFIPRRKGEFKSARLFFFSWWTGAAPRVKLVQKMDKLMLEFSLNKHYCVSGHTDNMCSIFQPLVTVKPFR